MAEEKKDEALVLRAYNRYREEATMAKHDRMALNRQNFNMYHLRQDFSHKNTGQSREFLPKQSMAIEQNSNFIKQGLVDLGEWFRTDAAAGINPDILKIRPAEIRKILNDQLNQMNIVDKVGDAIKLGLIGSLMIAKVGGRMSPKPKFRVKEELRARSFSRKLVKVEDKAWQLDISLVRQEDYYPDPTGSGLYEIQDSFMDLHEVVSLSKGEDAIFDSAVVDDLKGTFSVEPVDENFKKARETGQNPPSSGFRNRVKISEMWGNIIDSEGNLVHENIVTIIANDQFVIRKPTPNPLWHGESPFVVAPLLSVPHGVWGKALMDAPTQLNKAINELFNLMIDGGMMSVHGIKQIREDWLDDADQVENGIPPGETLKVNSAAPPGAKVLERVDTSSVPPDSLNMLNLLNQEFNASALTNDLRQGVQSFRSVKATEVIEASQSLASMFTGIAKVIEQEFMNKILTKSWMTIAQHIKDMDEERVAALIGKARANQIGELSGEEIFANTVNGVKFNTFGISTSLSKQRDLTKLQGLLQTVSGSEVLLEEYAKKFDFGKLLEEIMSALDIDTEKLKPREDEEFQNSTAQAGESDAVPNQQGGPDVQSQIPQAGSQANAGADTAQGNIPRAELATPPTAGAAANAAES